MTVTPDDSPPVRQQASTPFSVPYDWITRPREKRPVIVCIHGFLETAEIWQVLPTGLWEGHKAVSLPLPGHFPWILNDTVMARLLDGETLIDTYAACLRHLSPDAPVRLVGHSTGALVILELLLKYPELVEDAFVIAPLFSGVIKAQTALGRFLKLPFAGSAAFRWMLSRWLAGPSAFASGIEMVTGGSTTSGPELPAMRQALTRSPAAGLYSFGTWVGARSLSDRLDCLEVPVQALICAEDPVVDVTHQMELVRTAPMVQATLITAGHLPQFERPDLFGPIFMGWRERRRISPPQATS